MLGTAFITAVTEPLQQLGYYDVVVFGLLLIIVMVWTPQGLFVGLTQLLARVRESQSAIRSTQMTELVVSNVEKQFGGLKALRGVSFSIRAGELVAIIGPNGAGKSTLINCITGENPPTAGNVSFKNNDIGHWPPYQVNRAGVAGHFRPASCSRN